MERMVGERSTRYQRFYRDGKLEGEEKAWWENGQLEYQTVYKDGKREGEQKGWWDNGQPRYQEFYKDGKREGEQRWDRNGSLAYQDAIIRKKIACQNIIRQVWRNYRKKKFILLTKRLAYWSFVHVELRHKPGVGIDYFMCLEEFQLMASQQK